MSIDNKSQLQTNNAKVDDLVSFVQYGLREKVANLPDAGGDGVSVELCKVTITPDIILSPSNPTFYYTDENMNFLSKSTQNGEFYVPKNTMVAITNWNYYSSHSGDCSQLFYAEMKAVYRIMGDCSFMYSM